MALDQSWMLIVCAGIAFTASVLVAFIIINKKEKFRNKAYFSNTSRLTALPEYASLLRQYRTAMGVAAGCVALAIGLSAVLAAKPVIVESFTPTKYNRDIVLCLDVSGSMLEVDLKVVDKFQSMINEFKGERISLVVFNSTSNLVFPLTDDYDYISTHLEEVANGLKKEQGQATNGEGYDLLKYTLNGEGGSLIGDGLTACTLSFDKDDPSEKRSKSIILATDNVVNGSEIIPLDEAATYSAEQGIKVYGIQPTTGWEVGGEGAAMESAIEKTGGTYYPLDDPAATSDIVTKITAEEAGAIEGQTIVTKNDTPQPWIFGLGAVLLFVLGLCWRYRV